MKKNEISPDVLKRILSGKWTTSQVFDMLNGEPPRDEVEAQRIRDAALSIVGAPVEQWPSFKVSWDLSLESQRLALDGCSEAEFRRCYPNGLTIVHVHIVELDAHMTSTSLRTRSEVWSVGDKDKAARCLVHWIAGNAMTPPLVTVVGQQVGLAGGNHRLAVARAKGVDSLPILVNPKELDRLSNIVRIQCECGEH
jgi:hypothetical protein